VKSRKYLINIFDKDSTLTIFNDSLSHNVVICQL
jgi:hypothetical protein